MALVTTAGAVDANSYATLAEADAYHATRLYSSAWTSLVSGEKEAALIWATRLLDAAPGAWTGAAATETQALGWPRSGMVNRNGFGIEVDVIPPELKNATAEFARQLAIEDRTEDDTVLGQGITSIKAGPVALTFKDPLTEAEAADPAHRALGAVVPDAVKMLLVPSWLISPYDEAAPHTGLVFESL